MKKYHRFNLIDILICICTVVVFVVLSFSFSENFGESVFTGAVKNDVVFTIKTELLTNEYSDRLTPGQTIINFENGSELGVISDIELIGNENLPDGESLMTYAIVKVISDVEVKDNQYYLNDEKILVNMITKFSVPDLYFEGEITSIDSVRMDN